MKKLLLSIGIIASSFAAMSQVDTLTSHFVGNPTIYFAGSTPDSGYVSGSNAFGDRIKLQLFDSNYGVAGAGTISKVALLLPRKVGTGAFQVAIWSDNAGQPGNLMTPLGIGASTLALVDTSAAGYHLVDGSRVYNHIVALSAPVAIPANQKFWCGVVLPTTAGEILGIASNNLSTNPFAPSANYVGEVWGDGTYHSIVSAWGASAKMSLAIYPIINITSAAGLNENAISASVYPNPATDVLNIKTTEEIASVVITTTDGKTVATGNTSNINVASLNAGMYIYQLTTVSGKIGTGNFVKN